MKILARSTWTKTPNARAGRPLDPKSVVGIACHYPAMGNVKTLGKTKKAIAALIEGWRKLHIGPSRGWADIGYNFAVDQAGRVWNLTGFTVGAHAGEYGNPRYVGVLFILGNSEQPSEKMISAFREFRATEVLARYPKATLVQGHQQVPGNSTACPGGPLMALIRGGELAKRPTAKRRPAWKSVKLADSITALKAARKKAKRQGKPVRKRRFTAAIKRLKGK